MESNLSHINSSEVAITEEIAPGILCIRLQSHYDPNQLIVKIQLHIDDLFKAGHYRLMFDMENVIFPNSSFIAMLVGRTMEARRYSGDIKLLNVSDTTRNHMAMFSPVTYLSVGLDENAALESFAGVDDAAIADTDALDDGELQSLEVDATVDSLNMITQFVSTIANQVGMEPVEISKLKIAVYEAGMNIIEHGYQFEPGHSIGVEVARKENRLFITLIDQGKMFDFYNLKQYDVQSAFNEKRQGGYGLYIIQRSVDEIKYLNDSETGNRLTFIKRIS